MKGYFVPDFPVETFDAMVAEASQISVMAIRFAAKADAMTQEWASRRAGSAERDPLDPVREAMRQYDAEVAAGQHGRIAAAHFVDAIYAALAPAPVRVAEVVEVTTAEEQQLRWNPDEGDSEGWGG